MARRPASSYLTHPMKAFAIRDAKRWLAAAAMIAATSAGAIGVSHAADPKPSGHHALDLDGTNAGWLQSAEGGGVDAEATKEKRRAAPITIACGTGMSKGFYEWIKASFAKPHVTRDGAITTTDASSKPTSRLQFQNAFLSEVTFSALDAASKDAARMSIKITPETTHVTTSFGGSKEQLAARPAAPSKWLASSFRVRVDGFDDSFKHAVHVDAITVKQKNTEHVVGDMRAALKEPRGLEAPTLVVTLAEKDAEPVRRWMQATLNHGSSVKPPTKHGSIEYLSADGKPLFKLEFHGLGIFKLAPDNVEAGGETIKRVKVEMYADSATFDYAPAALEP
jgi:hypothetical protein